MKDTKELRGFLLDVMEDVRSGTLAIDKANAIHKTAGQVNESMYAELKAMNVMEKLGEVWEFGNLTIGEKDG